MAWNGIIVGYANVVFIRAALDPDRLQNFRMNTDWSLLPSLPPKIDGHTETVRIADHPVRSFLCFHGPRFSAEPAVTGILTLKTIFGDSQDRIIGD